MQVTSAVSEREPALPFVGSLTFQATIDVTAARMARDLDFGVEERRQASTRTAALRRFIAKADQAGILVMVNGVVGNNNRRKLSAPK